MTEPMVVTGYSCDCGAMTDSERMAFVGLPERTPVVLQDLDIIQKCWVCEICGSQVHFALEPVPDMGIPYSATERDEDSEYEYAREDAPLLREDRR